MSRLRQMTIISVLAAFGVGLWFFEVPLIPAAPFLKYDPGDIPVLIGAFALGPLTGVAISFLKCAVYVIMHASPDAFVGGFMNFLAGASFAVCAGNIYFLKKTKTRAVVSLVAGGLFSTLFMVAANLVVLPWFLRLFYPGAPDVTVDFLLAVIVPFNLVKATLNGVLVFVVYKKISPVLKAAHWELPARSPRTRPA